MFGAEKTGWECITVAGENGVFKIVNFIDSFLYDTKRARLQDIETRTLLQWFYNPIHKMHPLNIKEAYSSESKMRSSGFFYNAIVEEKRVDQAVEQFTFQIGGVLSELDKRVTQGDTAVISFVLSREEFDALAMDTSSGEYSNLKEKLVSIVKHANEKLSAQIAYSIGGGKFDDNIASNTASFLSPKDKAALFVLKKFPAEGVLKAAAESEVGLLEEAAGGGRGEEHIDIVADEDHDGAEAELGRAACDYSKGSDIS